MNDSNHKATGTYTFEEILDLDEPEKLRLGLMYTPREIAQQPATWQETFQLVKNSQDELQKFLSGCGLTQNGSEGLIVTLIGAGTSDYIGRGIAALFRKKWRCHVQVIASTDLMTEMGTIIESAPDNSRHLWISFSRSGDSFEGVRVIETALEKYPEIKHLIVTCNAEGRMAADLSGGQPNVFCLTLDDKVNDRGLAMTSSFTNMVVAGQCLANIWELESYKSTLDDLCASGTSILPAAAAQAAKFAKNNYSRICFLGTGTLRAVGDESALKVMELTAGYFSVMSESFLGLRHGPLSWLNRDSLVVGFLSNSAEKQSVELGLLEELREKAAAGNILIITPQENSALSGLSGHQLILDLPRSLDDEYRPPVDVIFAQCLGLFASLRHGLKPDTPSADGKIQRVVSNISIA